VPLRGFPFTFGAAEYVTAPLPFVVLIDNTVIQGALLVAVQLHAPGADTLMTPVHPADVNEWLEGDIEYWQGAAVW
jgi:hypothetical protein